MADLMSHDGTSPFDAIRHVDPEGVEFWKSRELGRELGYPRDSRNFEGVIQRAREACSKSGHDPIDHFVDVNEMVKIGSGASRQVTTTWMSRYASYLAVQNADSSKPQVARGQTYFALQTRRQEIEDERRVLLREEMTAHNKNLAGAAKDAGVVQPRDHAIFQNRGYQGLYDGRKMRDIHALKELRPKQHILDHMGSTELAANLFRTTQTEEKLRRAGVSDKATANRAHYEVGQRVRRAMAETGGVMPEDLPTAESIKVVKKRLDTKSAAELDQPKG